MNSYTKFLENPAKHDLNIRRFSFTSKRTPNKHTKVPCTSTSVIKSTLQSQCLDLQYITYTHVACICLVLLSCQVSEGKLYVSEINSSLCMSEIGNTGHKYLWTTQYAFISLFQKWLHQPCMCQGTCGCSTTKHNTKIQYAICI